MAALHSASLDTFVKPDGSLFLFLRLPGVTDDWAYCCRLLEEQQVVAVPGRAFGPGGEGFLRMCYLRDPDSLDEALDRLTAWLRQA